MIRTSGPLHYVEQESGGYEVTRDAWVELPCLYPKYSDYLNRDGRAVLSLEPVGDVTRLWLRAGYEWNGASGPTIDTSDTMWPSGMHDAGTKLCRAGYLSQRMVKVLDGMIRDMMIDRAGGNWFTRQLRKARAWAWYAGVRMPFGTAAAARRRQEKDDVEKTAA